MKGIRTLFTGLMLCACLGMTAQDKIFQEDDGLVVIEMESTTSDLGGWVFEDSIQGHTGSGYLRYGGPNQLNNPGTSTQTFWIKIDQTGTYRFQWRSRIMEGTSNTDHNDNWLRLPDADDFFAQKGGNILYPKGSGKTPNPNGAGKDGWFKVYMNQLNTWSWKTSTSDNDPHNIFATFDNPGVYTVEISGRSAGHGIDRFVLYHEDVDGATATDEDQPESQEVITSTTETRKSPSGMEVFPNPVRDLLQVRMPENMAGSGNLQVGLTDGLGRRVWLREAAYQPVLQWPAPTLPPGAYVLTVRSDKEQLACRVLIAGQR